MDPKSTISTTPLPKSNEGPIHSKREERLRI
jgi:hypothetical protein